MNVVAKAGGVKFKVQSLKFAFNTVSRDIR